MDSAVMPTYGRADLAFERGEGPYLVATDGRRFLDFAAGIAVNVLGHGHPHLVRALTQQAQGLWHISNLYRIPEQERLARRLAEASFADRVFFCNSGAEANECAIKIARKYHDATGHPERYRIITATGAFHGRTLATLAAGGNPEKLAGFGPVVDGFDQVPLGNFNMLRAAITSETAAILVEPIQGDGGINPAGADYLRQLRQTADEFGLLLIFDEVQSGMGRIGTLFAHERAGIAPDIATLAKGLGNGFPVGACLATEAASIGMTAGSHASTFGGNPLAMAVANAVLDVLLADGFLDHVDAVAAELYDGLQYLVLRHPKVLAEARGQGLMLGLKCRLPNAAVVDAARAQRLLTVPAADNVVRLLPPLVIETEHVAEAVEALDRACTALAA
ncbi:MAG: aspartate aminotransferase family protein [Proteobacteria bacterium]|nr:aspartate aminotransferase family protein [Pseudomonadota bacterium]MBI3497312.1 aspartate aminotransferase family protein [Pseudomonadota bacterium]